MMMKFVMVVAIAMALVAAAPLLTPEWVEQINSEAKGWTAGPNEYFYKSTKEEIQRLCGVIDDGVRLPARTLFEDDVLASLPSNFSWVEKGKVGDVRNQGSCGSCWAFGGVEALSDRFRIAGHDVNASALDPVTCDDGWFAGNNGCHGGSPSALWSYLASSGAVSESCAPYLTSEGGPIPTCPPEQQPCLNFVDTPSCSKHCKNGQSWSSAKLVAATAYSVSSDPNQIMAEIYKHGPVEGAFSVFSDFPAYKSGVYRRTPSSTELGGHAIEIVGWGILDNTPYWEVRNSWTTTWGDNGYFKILRGVNECGIEGDIVAGAPFISH